MNEIPQKLPLAQAFVPFQEKSVIYPADEVLCKGTIYPELYKPYVNPWERGDSK